MVGMVKEQEAEYKAKLKREYNINEPLLLMMYEASTGVIYEISQSLQAKFGLRCSMFHTQHSNSPTLALLSPDLLVLEKQEGLMSPQGEIITFDTSMLKDNQLLVGFDEDEDYSLEDQQPYKQKSELEQDPALPLVHSEVARQGDERFHSSRCRAWICSQQIIDGKDIVSLRFAIIDQANAEAEKTETENSMIEVKEDKDNRSRESLMSQDSGEEIDKIKHSRAALTNNSVPQSIILIRNLFLTAVVVYMAVFIYSKWQKDKDYQNIEDSLEKFAQLAKRNIYITDTAGLLRLYEMTVK